MKDFQISVYSVGRQDAENLLMIHGWISRVLLPRTVYIHRHGDCVLKNAGFVKVYRQIRNIGNLIIDHIMVYIYNR